MQLQVGDRCAMHDSAARAAVIRGDATWLDGSTGPYPPVAAPERKVVSPPETKSGAQAEAIVDTVEANATVEPSAQAEPTEPPAKKPARSRKAKG